MKRALLYFIILLLSLFLYSVLSNMYMLRTLNIKKAITFSCLDIKDMYYTIFPSAVPDERFPNNISYSYFVDTIHISRPYIMADKTGVYIKSKEGKEKFKMFIDSDDDYLGMNNTVEYLNRKLFWHFWDNIDLFTKQDSYLMVEQFKDSLYMDFKCQPKGFLVILRRESEMTFDYTDNLGYVADFIFQNDYTIYLTPIWTKRQRRILRKEIVYGHDEDYTDNEMWGLVSKFNQ